VNRRMSCEQIQTLVEGYGRFNSRKYGKPDSSDGDAVESLDDVPDVSEEDQALLQTHLRGYYGITG
jgi:hypothetical protein